MMKFTYEGQQYLIEFCRERYNLRKFDKGNDYPFQLVIKSKHPYTTVNIMLMEEPRSATSKGKVSVYRSATVGCYHKDRYTHEQGRITALREVGRTLPKEFKGAMWDAYRNRREEGVKVD